MKIDPTAFAATVKALDAMGGNIDWTAEQVAERAITTYLSALPSAEPGRDRIAVVVNGFGLAVTAAGHRMTEESWRAMENELSNGPFARAIIHCNLPRPAEPVEVEGSVEGVGP